MRIRRRDLLTALAAGAGLASLKAPFVRAQAAPIRIGLLTVKTGPLASGGIQMEQGLRVYLKDRNNTLVGRPIELIVADTAGVPATARTKTQELVERDAVSCLFGPLAAFEALAIDDYIRQQKIPTIGFASADDLTQRKPNPWFVRASATSSQCSHVMADYAAKELKYKRMALIADDFAYGHEQNAGFQRVFEDAGGRIVQKLWPPLAIPDYGTYIVQLKQDIDGLFIGFAGSNGFRFLRQFNEYGLKGKIPVVGGMSALDEAILQNMGEEALGTISACWYSGQLDNPANKAFVAGMRRDFNAEPGYYGAATYVMAAVFDAALKASDGKPEDKERFIETVRNIKVPDTARGAVRFDQYGNVVGNVYIRRVERKDGKLVNTVIETYPDVSQFWTYKPEDYLKQPVYSRDNPPARYLEN